MVRRRPRPPHPAVIVIAVLHLIGACFGLCVFSFHAFLGEQLKEMKRQQLQQQNPGVFLVFEEDLRPELQTVERVEAWANVAFTLALLVAGIGLLCRQGWARWLSVAYAILSILFKVGDTVAVFGYIAPMRGDIVNADEVGAQLAGYLIAMVLGLVYAVAVLVVMFLPAVARSFRRERVPSYLFEDEDDAFDDYEDEEDYPRYGRRR
jgi:hypothetical protein